MNHDEHRPPGDRPPSDRALGAGDFAVEHRRVNASGAIVVVLAVVGLAVYLITDHWPHVLAALPYAAIIAVVGVHLLMHRGHGHSGHGHGGHDHGGLTDTRPDRRNA